MGQSDLGAFGAGENGRPTGEAAAIAGDEAGPVSAVVDREAARYPDTDGVVEIAVTQVDYTLVGSGSDERPVMHVFGRTADNTAEHVRVHGFRPYFYVPIASLEAGELETIDGVTGWEETDEEGEPYISIRGERVTKVFGRTPRDVGEIRDRFDHHEADILFPNRFLIDKGIESGMRVPARRATDGAIDVPHEEVAAVEATADLRVNTFDIEVDDRRGFPEDGEEPILCLTSHDSYDDEYVAWLYASPDGTGDLPEALPRHDRLDEGEPVEVNVYETEEAMLAAFLDYLDETDPDVITGWNFSDFDAPYLVSRLRRLNSGTEHDLDFNRLSRVNEVWESDWQGPNIKGRVVFDLLYAYRRTQFSELDSYRLDAVGETELGVGKERYTGAIGDLWEEDPERLLEYNVRDVELCVEIDRKQGIIPFWREVASFVGCKLEDATTPGDAVDMYVLHKVHGEYVLPSKGRVESEEYEGGAVFDPITGVREMVAVLDLKSLYPMCMVTINASPETKVGPDYDGATYQAPNDQRFRQEPPGMIREMVDELLGEREAKKDRRDEFEPGSAEYGRFDRQQAAVKVIMNSLYGVLGWERFRLYDKEMADAVTATGREVIRHTQMVANELGYEVVYGDTDSIMLEIGHDLSKEEAIERAFEIVESINASYDEFAPEHLGATDHRFEIEFEKLYRRFFQAGKKKRYAGHIIFKEGKDVDDIDITGFEYKRSDIAPITKEVQREVIERIVRGAPTDEVIAYVQDVIAEFEEGRLDPEDVGIPGGIGKRLGEYDTDTAHVRGAKYANLLFGTNFGRGSKPKRLYLDRVDPAFYEGFRDEHPELFPNGDGMDSGGRQLTREQRRQRQLFTEFRTKEDVICFEFADQLPEEFSIDWEVMLEKTLQGPIERVLEALGVSWEEVRSGQEQTGLESFQ